MRTGILYLVADTNAAEGGIRERAAHELSRQPVDSNATSRFCAATWSRAR